MDCARAASSAVMSCIPMCPALPSVVWSGSPSPGNTHGPASFGSSIVGSSRSSCCGHLDATATEHENKTTRLCGRKEVSSEPDIRCLSPWQEPMPQLQVSGEAGGGVRGKLERGGCGPPAWDSDASRHHCCRPNSSNKVRQGLLPRLQYELHTLSRTHLCFPPAPLQHL